MKSFFLILFLCADNGVLAGRIARQEPDTLWTYKRIQGKQLQMSVFLPEKYQNPMEAFPVMVIFHGGSWKEGEPSWHYPDCDYWSKRGMVAISVDYRLKDRDSVEVPLECVKDAKSAIRYLRKNARELKIDPDKIVAAGGSAGGQMAAATAMVSSENTNDNLDDLSFSCVPNAVILYNPFFHCKAELSPPNFVQAGLPPTIMFLGDQDPAISVEELKSFQKALKTHGNSAILYVGEGGWHGFCNGMNPVNPFFYWSLDLEDQFLVAHGILIGMSMVQIPEGVKQLLAEDYEVYE